MNPEPGLYVHVPFCSAICPYCDFAVTLGASSRADRFAKRLTQEVELRGTPSRPFDTLYFGGGTPSLLEPEAIAEMVAALRSRGWLRHNCRLFLEANPEDRCRFPGFRRAGVHTLSLGVQSFDDDSLHFLGRRHSAEDSRNAIWLACEAGFETLSVDLIYGLPGQTVDRWRLELEQVAKLPVDHVSCYQLTVHQNTMFARQKIEEPPEPAQAELFRVTHRVLADLGFEGYEVSNFARSLSHRSAHNEKYWSHAPYLGLGPSAHSFTGRDRFWNERSFFEWEKRLASERLPVAGSECLDDAALALETLMLRLRTRQGLDLCAYERRFGINLRERSAPAVRDGLLAVDDGWLRPTLDGLAVADRLAVSLSR
ncbi:MAG TPA: radical SAM family heme chaperone HemW [Vicinamibacteria bacterium]|nr:radical SAM family heme chaperone HemW [Vicinamibacteria bacterium]